jgi:hypothetical protein
MVRRFGMAVPSRQVIEILDPIGRSCKGGLTKDVSCRRHGYQPQSILVGTMAFLDAGAGTLTISGTQE